MSRRSQSAMEYLMTYGWAILIIAVVLAALFSIGVFNGASGGGASTCVEISGFSCTGPTLTSGGLLSATIGEFGQTITITGTACTTSANLAGTSFRSVSGVTLNSGQSSSLSFACTVSSSSNSPIGTKFTGYLWLQYSVPGGSTLSQIIGTATTSVTSIGSSCLATANTLSSTGGNPYSVTVPANCGHVTFTLAGGSGATTGVGTSGAGGYIQGTNVVVAGTTLYVWVGGGALSGGASGTPGGGGSLAGGGGCSAVSTSSSSTWLTAAGSALAIAAGGGGGGYNNGGNGGGTSGTSAAYGGGAGTQSGAGLGTEGGGNGGAYTGGSGNTGGGCGYYGGGGDNNQNGGGGGSSWSAASVSSVTNTNGGGAAGDGNTGSVTLTWGT